MVLMTTVALIMMVVLMMTWITKVAAWLCEERKDVGHEQRHWGRGLGIHQQYLLHQNCHHDHNLHSNGYEFRFCRITAILESQGVNTSRNLFTRTVTQEPALRPSNEHERCPERRASEMKHMLIYSIIYLIYILDYTLVDQVHLVFLQHPFVQHSSTPHGRESFDSRNSITFDAVDSFAFGAQLTNTNTLYLYQSRSHWHFNF